MFVQRLSCHATLPTRGSARAAGYDLYAAADMEIPAGGKGLVPTDIAISMPDGVYGRVAPRSGLALKNHIAVGAGVVDGDYRGAIGVVLFNHGQEPFRVARGDRVAQLILEQYLAAPVVEVDSLPGTARGAAGFGSTGL